MSWRDRPYSTDDDCCGGSQPEGGLRSWVGGIPSPGRAVKLILLANVGLFVLCLITGGFSSPVYRWLAMNTRLVLEGQVWRLFTFTYLHDQENLLHILFNMLGLYFLGQPLERSWGSKRFFAFYTLGGFVAVLLYLVMTTIGPLSPEGILVGASGGVLAILGACAVLFPQIRIIMVVFPVPIRAAALLLVAIYGFNLLNQGDNAGGDACHLAGLGFGILWGYRGERWMQAWSGWRASARQGAWEAKRRRQESLEREVDRILDKVHREGINRLTRSEKRKLEEATRLQQEEDRRHRVG